MPDSPSEDPTIALTTGELSTLVTADNAEGGTETSTTYQSRATAIQTAGNAVGAGIGDWWILQLKKLAAYIATQH